MDRSYVTENAAERARLQALVARLTDADMARPVSEDWTVGVALMHLAFWDGLSFSKFEEWERTGTVDIPPLRDMVDGINNAMLPWWRTVAPAQIRHAVVAAAEAVDRKVETLPAPIVEAILAVRPRSLTRAIHRRQHLDQIERALAG
jgi:Mycothiol maleylpyruvate isomerase N-terminal domain